MRIIFVIIFSFLLVEVHKTYGQTSDYLKGRVLNSELEPLEGAVVSTQYGSVVTTNDSGHFTILAISQGSMALTARALGSYDTTVIIQIQKGMNEAIIICQKNPQALQPVTVTAEKKESNLQHTPIAVSAFGAQKIRNYRIWSLEDISAIAPNIFTSVTSDVPQISIRGITQNGGGSFDPPYAIYIDGVMQYDANSMITELYDVERIEVLRGPQGTLYGKNATAGVINVVTAKPGNATSGYVEASLGNRGTQRHVVSLKAPLVKNKLYAGIAGFYNRSDGYIRNAYDNSKFDRRSSYSGNLNLRFLPSDHWKLLLNIKSQCNSAHGVFPFISYTDKEAIKSYTTNQNVTGEQRRNFVNASLSVQNNNRLFAISSVTSYQYSDRMIYNGAWDFDWTADDFSYSSYLGKPSDNAAKALMQELRFSNRSKKDKLQWLVGAFYSYYDRNEMGMLSLGQKAAELGDPYAPYGLYTPLDVYNTSFAFFGQGMFAVTERLRVTGGLRYDWEQKHLTTRTDLVKEGVPSMHLVDLTKMKGTYKALSPRLNISYHFSPRLMAYFNYARGFRAGGLNTRTRSSDYFTYAPEFTSNYEVAVRSNLLNNRLMANLNLFLIDWNDMQVTMFIPGGAGNYALQNAGGARSKGIELEVSAILKKGLSLDYNFGYTRGRYSKLTVPDLPTKTEADAAGRVLINQPALTSMLAPQYTHPVLPGIGALIRLEYIISGTQYFDFLNAIRQDAYCLLNAKAGMTSRHADIFVWGRNLTNQHYLAGIYASGAPFAIPANPVAFGITLTGRL